MALYTQESIEEKNNSLFIVMIILLLVGSIHTIATTDTLRGIIISLILILICAVLTTVGIN